MMSTLHERYIDPAFVYRYTHGPRMVLSKEEAMLRGINCVSLVHLVLKDLFDYQLPPDLDCYELYNDQEHMSPVADVERMQAGDLVWFGRQNPAVEPEDFRPVYQNGQLLNWSEFPVRHVAIYTGEYSDDHLLLHSTYIEGTNVVWPLFRFANYARYRKMYGISRLRNVA